MIHDIKKYTCDSCGKNLPTFRNQINIVTDKNKDSPFWERLHVKIEFNHGLGNTGDVDDADLCQKCARNLLRDAARRVALGERVSKGVETVEQQGWLTKKGWLIKEEKGK